jgi:hypothetical protein
MKEEEEDNEQEMAMEGGEREKGGAVGDVNKRSWRRQQLKISEGLDNDNYYYCLIES